MTVQVDFDQHRLNFLIRCTMLIACLITIFVLTKCVRFPLALITSSLLTSLVLLFVDSVLSIQITKFQVPTYVTLGEPVEMKCEFNLSKEEIIYTIKWYKEEVEFFRYEPGQRPKTKYFSVPGINVDVSHFVLFTSVSSMRVQTAD